MHQGSRQHLVSSNTPNNVVHKISTTPNKVQQNNVNPVNPLKNYNHTKIRSPMMKAMDKSPQKRTSLKTTI